MKKVLLLAITFGCVGLAHAQWYPAGNTDHLSTIYRTGKVGIGLALADVTDTLSVKNNFSIQGDMVLNSQVRYKIAIDDSDSSVMIISRDNNTLASKPGRAIKWSTLSNETVSMILSDQGNLSVGPDLNIQGQYRLAVTSHDPLGPNYKHPRLAFTRSGYGI